MTTMHWYERVRMLKADPPTKAELFEMWVDGVIPNWDEYINCLDELFPMSDAEYQRRLALAWTPSMLVGCAP